MNTGDTVYWLSTCKGLICSGKVVLVHPDNSPDGGPEEIVVEYGGGFVVRRACQAWDNWYTTAAEAYRAGINDLSRRIVEANKAMLSLIDSQQKGGSA